MSKHSRKAAKKKAKKRSQAARLHPSAVPQRAPEVITPTSPALAQEQHASVPRYDYVRGELKKIGIIAGAIFVLLVSLSFILPHILS